MGSSLRAPASGRRGAHLSIAYPLTWSAAVAWSAKAASPRARSALVGLHATARGGGSERNRRAATSSLDAEADEAVGRNVVLALVLLDLGDLASAAAPGVDKG